MKAPPDLPHGPRMRVRPFHPRAPILLSLWIGVTLSVASRPVHARATPTSNARTIRVAAAQAANRIVNYRLSVHDALAAVEMNLEELRVLVDRAGQARCDALVLPEDTPGLLNWVGANESIAKDLLPSAVDRMITRLGIAAAAHRMYLVVCSDHVENGAIYNTSFLLGRDGKEIGRYHKACPTWGESGARARGDRFPVFPTPDLGVAGMLICYDLVIPETARCLALQGADIIFFPTMGGAAIGDDDIGEQALRVRAAENFVWLVVAHRGSGAMIISPQGKIVARAAGRDGLAIADIDVLGNREGGDALDQQKDMRARLFRERNPEAFGILTEPRPPILEKAPIARSRQDSGRIMARALTVGEEEFREANRLAARPRPVEAIAAFERLRQEYPGTWIDRRSAERLATLRPEPPRSESIEWGLAEKYPADVGIAGDPDVLFADDFESGGLDRWDERRGRRVMVRRPSSNPENTKARSRSESAGNPTVLADSHDTISPHAGDWCVQIPMERGRNHGGDAIKWFLPGADTVYARVYVRFSHDYQYNHHFLWLGANHRTNRWSAFGKAGLKPDGTYYSTGMEPWFAWGQNPSPGEANLYSYYLDMEPDRKMNKYWGNGFFPPGPGKGQAAGPSRAIPKLATWQCWEFMIQANSSPDQADGKQAMWIDGKRIGDFSGIRWRRDPELKVNCFWLQHYGYDEGDPTKSHWKDSQSVWFDDVVVAKRYIGPMKRIGGTP